MAKKTTVSIDDFSFFEEDELQPFNIIVKTIQKAKSLKNHEPRPEEIMSQSGANHEPIMSQSGANHEPIMSQKTLCFENHEPQPEPLHEPIMSQSGANHEPNNDFDSLVGLQKNVLLYIFNSCLNAGNKISSAITTSNLATSMDSTIAAIRKAIQRLESKGFIKRSQFKDGRGGWTKYELSTLVYSNLLTRQSRANHEPIMSQSGAKRKPQPEPQPEPTGPCSSSNLNINTTTTEDPWFAVPEKLQGQLPLQQIRAFLKSGVIDLATLEDSLWGFAHDLEKGLVKSKTGNTTGLFIGALKNGGYISQQYLSQKQQELVELKERAEEFKKLQVELETNKFTEEFEVFKAKYPEKAEQLKPAGKFIKTFETGSLGYRMWLDEYKRSQENSTSANQQPILST